jgi:hypothetical protein
MGWPVPTNGHATSVLLTSDGGEPIPAIPGMPDPTDHGMQEARGSNPLSSTPGQRSYAAPVPRDSSPSRSICAASGGRVRLWILVERAASGHYGAAAEGGSLPSTAYLAWFGYRQARIGQLLVAHQTLSGTGRGSRSRAEQLSWVLTLRLAGEFQGFARELHDVAVDHLVAVVAGGNTGLANVLRAGMTARRQLDRGNASPANLEEDYLRLGVLFWPDLRAANSRAPAWKANLAALNEARNAIAHVDERKLNALRARGYPITLTTVSRWKTSLDGLVRTMDDVVGAYLGRLLGTGSPW